MTLNALVTGGGAGLGKALVEGLLDRGYLVVAVDRDAAALAALPDPTTRVIADLGDADCLSRLVASLDRHMSFDIVVMNAGVNATGPFERIDPLRHTDTIAVNLVAPLALTALMLGQNLLHRGSTLVFVSSLSHRVGYPGAAVYAASKDGIAVFARSLKRPLRRLGIQILTVLPGPRDTEHARRHAPPGSDGRGRIAPARVADAIIRRIGRPGTLIPGHGASCDGSARSAIPSARRSGDA
jgi:cyclic-di-GMP-binding biofilm dispersal mediator protein